MRVVGDAYGFEADLVDKVASIHHEQERLYAIQPSHEQAFANLNATGGKDWKTAALLELESRIADKQAASACPPSYKALDSRQDRARLKEIEAESTRRPLTSAEQTEEQYLQARLEVYWWTSEEAERRKMNRLKWLSDCPLGDCRTPDEQREFERLKTRYGDTPFTLIEEPFEQPSFATEALRRIKPYQPGKG
jgi:hypothetical protein